uniref:RanBP2-type domain-containing protein n=1 Tax=Pipistrellus kuhlii TaxID=59472 RepID=A0A7J7UMC2_PIPKU|nr:hypothetical protein mPipKuh1_008774 [Pipistrellus kuhlii]
MAGNFGDAAGGFRHNEVVSFINNEVLLNGGGPDFYTTLRSQSWNEIEDRLQAVLTDPQVPRMRQRACTWSALALGVRVAARQYEHQVHRIQQLQNRVEEGKTISWALTSQLRQMLRERDQAASKLQGILTALQQAKGERDTMSRRLNQVKVSTPTKALPQAVQPVRRDQLPRAPPWPMTAEKQGKMAATGAHNMPLLKTPVAALGVGAQKKIASLSDQRVYPVVPQKYLLGNSKSQAQGKGPVMPQGYYFLGNSNSLGQAKGPVVPQWKYSLGNSKSHGQGKGQLLMLKYPEKQKPQGQKAKQAKRIRASEFQHQGMTASPNNRQNWDCSWCKMINYSWCKFCCKCKKVRMAVQRGGLRP